MSPEMCSSYHTVEVLLRRGCGARDYIASTSCTSYDSVTSHQQNEAGRDGCHLQGVRDDFPRSFSPSSEF